MSSARVGVTGSLMWARAITPVMMWGHRRAEPRLWSPGVKANDLGWIFVPYSDTPFVLDMNGWV